MVEREPETILLCRPLRLEIRHTLAMLWNPNAPTLIGVVHLPATPGAPGFSGSFGAVVEEAVRDARALATGGCDGIIVENFGDAPFFQGEVPPETIAGLALAVQAVREVAEGAAVGVNVLRNDVRAALGIAAVTDSSFVRVNVHTGAMVTDQGLIQGEAAATVRERERLCPAVQIFADVHVKHAAPLAPSSIEESAVETLGRGRADAVILSGVATGAPVDCAELARVRERAAGARILIGSGLTAENADSLLAFADGAIVGTYLKRDGVLANPVDAERVKRLRECFDRLSPIR